MRRRKLCRSNERIYNTSVEKFSSRDIITASFALKEVIVPEAMGEVCNPFGHRVACVCANI